jgi:hypothetical protein
MAKGREFWEVNSCAKAMDRLKRMLSTRQLMQRADYFKKINAVRLGLRRWVGYHTRYLSKIRQAKIHFEKRCERDVSRTLATWMKRCVRKSWK